MTAKAVPEDMSFEDALAELEGIVSDLEGGKAALEDSIKSYERGIALKKHCEKKLSAAQEKIEKITIGPDGEPRTEPFDVKE
jgi:exodeoxyribonuclease VII small subunit